MKLCFSNFGSNKLLIIKIHWSNKRKHLTHIRDRGEWANVIAKHCERNWIQIFLFSQNKIIIQSLLPLMKQLLLHLKLTTTHNNDDVDPVLEHHILQLPDTLVVHFHYKWYYSTHNVNLWLIVLMPHLHWCLKN